MACRRGALALVVPRRHHHLEIKCPRAGTRYYTRARPASACLPRRMAEQLGRVPLASVQSVPTPGRRFELPANLHGRLLAARRVVAFPNADKAEAPPALGSPWPGIVRLGSGTLGPRGALGSRHNIPITHEPKDRACRCRAVPRWHNAFPIDQPPRLDVHRAPLNEQARVLEAPSRYGPVAATSRCCRRSRAALRSARRRARRSPQSARTPQSDGPLSRETPCNAYVLPVALLSGPGPAAEGGSAEQRTCRDDDGQSEDQTDERCAGLGEAGGDEQRRGGKHVGGRPDRTG